MWRLILFFIFLNTSVYSEDAKTRTVILKEGGVVGTKYWDGDFYEFYGIPYATAPTGRDKFQAPLPAEPWDNIFDATDSKTVCYQAYFNDEDDEFILSGDDECLHINLLVPEIASENNLVPVLVYLHSGAYAGGNGNMARYHYLARHDIIVISFNYRLGAMGFACLGNKEIPGNAGLKDQVAALRWIKENVKKFGGDPNKITLAGYSVGASMAELLTLSKATDGLINQLILESGSSLASFSINRDPIATAKNLALAMGYEGTMTMEGLTEFYLNVSIETMSSQSLNFFLPNSTFGFSPCIENVHEGIEPFLTESPLDILKRGQYTKIPVLIGFSNMEGISRTNKFGEWREKMTEDFSDFLPADLVFDSENSKQAVIKEIKERYFQGNVVNHEKLQGYVDYFSAAMFKYSVLKSLRLRAGISNGPFYLYEFNYIGKLSMQHNYMDRLKGASHRDQTGYILDFYGWTNSYRDLDMRDRMTRMWADFVLYRDPTAYESLIINYKWLSYTNTNQNYLHISRKPTMKQNLFDDEFIFWDKLYEKYYWNPTAPTGLKIEIDETKESQTKHTADKVKNIRKNESDKKEHTRSQEEELKEQRANENRKEDMKAPQETIKKDQENNKVKKENNEAKQEDIKKDQENNKMKKKNNEAEQGDVKEKRTENVPDIKGGKGNEQKVNDKKEGVKIKKEKIQVKNIKV